MPVNDRTVERDQTATVPRGTVGACTADDKATLFELYRAVYPNASLADLLADIQEQEAAAWATYRDERGEIRVAMFVRSDGVVWLFARPADCHLEEIRRGLLALAEHVHQALRPSGVKHLVLVHASSLSPLVEGLAKEGLLGEPFNIARLMNFGDQGQVARKN